MRTAVVLQWPTKPVSNVTRLLERIDPREVPEYSLSEVALYVDVPERTLGYWCYPTRKDPAIIVPASSKEPMLSFYNLLEAHILQATRQRDIPLQSLRNALYALRANNPHAPHPLLDHEFYAVDGWRDVFIQALEGGDPINISRGGQGAFGPILKRYLKRIEWDRSGPIRLMPARSNRIVIDLNVSGGRPVIKGTGVLAKMLWSRRKAGDSLEKLARDYQLKRRDVEEAIRYIEQPAA